MFSRKLHLLLAAILLVTPSIAVASMNGPPAKKGPHRIQKLTITPGNHPLIAFRPITKRIDASQTPSYQLVIFPAGTAKYAPPTPTGVHDALDPMELVVLRNLDSVLITPDETDFDGAEIILEQRPNYTLCWRYAANYSYKSQGNYTTISPNYPKNDGLDHIQTKAGNIIPISQKC